MLDSGSIKYEQRMTDEYPTKADDGKHGIEQVQPDDGVGCCTHGASIDGVIIAEAVSEMGVK